MKKFCIILSSLLFYACGVSHLKVNGSKKYVISTECGKLEVSADYKKQYNNYRIKFKSIEGDFDLKTGSIDRFVSFSNYFYYADLFTVTHSSDNLKTLKENETLEVYFIKSLIKDKDFPLGAPLQYTMRLAPGDYLQCNGGNVITDTLTMSR